MCGADNFTWNRLLVLGVLMQGISHRGDRLMTARGDDPPVLTAVFAGNSLLSQEFGAATHATSNC